MKKILLIITIVFFIYLMVISAVEITMGPGAINRSASNSAGPYTYIEKNNPANASGTITNFEVFPYQSIYNVEVATFYLVSGNILSTRDSEAVGDALGGWEAFEVNLDVQEGDYIGIYYSSGKLEYGLGGGGAGHWKSVGDKIPCSEFEFVYSSTAWGISIYATGATPEIDIGSPAIDRNIYCSALYTSVDENNAANASGTIDTIKVWANTNLNTFYVATFYVVSDNNLTARDVVKVSHAGTAAIIAGSEVTRTVDYLGAPISLNVVAGDYIGAYISGKLDLSSDSGGGGWWYQSGDQTECIDTTFDHVATNRIMSLNGTGTIEEEEAEVNIIMMGTNF